MRTRTEAGVGNAMGWAGAGRGGGTLACLGCLEEDVVAAVGAWGWLLHLNASVTLQSAIADARVSRRNEAMLGSWLCLSWRPSLVRSTWVREQGSDMAVGDDGFQRAG